MASCIWSIHDPVLVHHSIVVNPCRPIRAPGCAVEPYGIGDEFLDKKFLRKTVELYRDDPPRYETFRIVQISRHAFDVFNSSDKD